MEADAGPDIAEPHDGRDVQSQLVPGAVRLQPLLGASVPSEPPDMQLDSRSAKRLRVEDAGAEGEGSQTRPTQVLDPTQVVTSSLQEEAQLQAAAGNRRLAAFLQLVAADHITLLELEAADLFERRRQHMAVAFPGFFDDPELTELYNSSLPEMLAVIPTLYRELITKMGRMSVDKVMVAQQEQVKADCYIRFARRLAAKLAAMPSSEQEEGSGATDIPPASPPLPSVSLPGPPERSLSGGNTGDMPSSEAGPSSTSQSSAMDLSWAFLPEQAEASLGAGAMQAPGAAELAKAQQASLEAAEAHAVAQTKKKAFWDSLVDLARARNTAAGVIVIKAGQHAHYHVVSDFPYHLQVDSGASVTIHSRDGQPVKMPYQVSVMGTFNISCSLTLSDGLNGQALDSSEFQRLPVYTYPGMTEFHEDV